MAGKKKADGEKGELLVPKDKVHILTEEERQRGRETRKQNFDEAKEFQKLTRLFLNQTTGDMYKKNLQLLGFDKNDMTNKAALIASMFVKAMKNGDAKCAKTLMEWAGYDPDQILKREQFEYTKENGSNINVKLDGELETTSRVQIYLPEIEKTEE